MDNLLIEKTESTPYINFNYDTNKLIISGESFPENAVKFYEPVMTWIKSFLEEEEPEETEIVFEIVYFNSSTSKIYMMIFNLLDEAAKKGKAIVIYWRVTKDNETAIECGEEFMEDLEFVNFEILYI